jgi:cobaltochelatase CobT
MDQLFQKTREQQKIEELCAGVIRALTGEDGIQYRGQRLHKGASPLEINAPHLHTDFSIDDFCSFRGVADSIALRLRYSDPEVHRQLSPENPIERLVFELLEQLRVEALVPGNLPGMANNLRHRFTTWLRAYHQSGLTESASGILLYTVFQVCWSRLKAEPVLEEAEDLIESTRAAIVPLLGKNLAGLRRERYDQEAYARHAYDICRVIGEMIRDAECLQNTQEKRDGQNVGKGTFRLLLDFSDNNPDRPGAAPLGESKTFDEAVSGYTAFTTQYDRQADGISLVRKKLLREYREQLDQRVMSLGINIARLARQSAFLLATPQRSGWSFGEEDGYIDASRLAQLISSPLDRRLFRQEEHKPHADCLVSFLVDCSGSMKTHSESIPVLVDILVRAMERAGVATEVLGFTTGAWNGGRAHRDWTRANSPRNPGRLNELFHMVFKDANVSWRHARTGIAALLKADLYREGIDGEAVDWACNRMRSRPERRRILLVISDGCPMDRATNLANGDFYLANHLKEVIARHEVTGEFEICALGVGLDLSTYYSRSLATSLPQSLNNALFFEIVQLIGGCRKT